MNHVQAQYGKEGKGAAGDNAGRGVKAGPIAPDERNLVTRKFNETRHEPLGDRCLPELLRDQARARPDSTAVVCGARSLTYRELADGSTELARYLRRLGVGAEDGVGLFVEPSIDLMVGAWGILFAGAAYLPLSPEYPEERLRYMIEDRRTRVILTQEGLAERLAELAPPSTRIITLNDAHEFAAAHPHNAGEEFDPGLSPGNLAYIIYTSGSTGKPKGVMIEHRGIVNQMRWMNSVQKLDKDKVVLQKTPMSFDAAQWEILAPSCGSKVVMGDPGVYRDPERLIETITTHGITTLQCVPALLQALLDTEMLFNCESLTQIFSGGEALSKALALQCLETLPDCELVNLYGPTECTINTSAFTVDRHTVAEGPQRISIGAPVHNTQYYILDGLRSPVAVGEVGELYIGGVQVARGYLNRPDMTSDRFVVNPFQADHGYPTLYRTGDLAYWDADGTVQFVGRTDNQVKLRGFRVELDEIRLAIENHDWVKSAAVVVRHDTRTRFQNLIAFIELNPKEAALMDQGSHGVHHQSKESKLQIRAQLANTGCRDAAELAGRPVIDLPGRAPTPEQQRRVFARKTYRFFEGGTVTRADVLELLARRPAGTVPRALTELTLAELGRLLRHFGQYLSNERLLPKYGYASPGSLYATQLYFEINEVAGLRSGHYYYHPLRHRLVLIGAAPAAPGPRLRVRFVGKRQAIEPVYKTNIEEVLEIEAGHMVGLFEEVLPEYGLTITDLPDDPEAMDALDCGDEDHHLGTFEIVPGTVPPPARRLDTYVQAHPGMVADLPAGQYLYEDGELRRIADDLVLKKHVIAINQQVYERSSIGISFVCGGRDDRLSYVDLGRALHHLQANDLNLGLMSSGYSSRTGQDLPSARRLERILDACGRESGPSYFAVGGRISDEQRLSRGMKEDVVHMKGPTEMIRDDLINFLPYYMMPNRVVVLDALPLTASGKVDGKALETWDLAGADFADRPFIAPRTGTERRIAELWKTAMRRSVVSVRDDFFESGGNSLIAVSLVNRINKEFQSTLSLQVVFESPTIEELARRLDAGPSAPSSRLVRLRPDGTGSPVYCWPGLGGYPMNLRSLADRAGIDRPIYGVQAYGINPGETPYPTIREMAAEDVGAIRRIQPDGPYTLWGYSFGARVAFETAYQLERAGHTVENLFLIAPGSPHLDAAEDRDAPPGFGNRAYLTILFSVFAGGTTGALLAECLELATDEESFAAFISAKVRDLDPETVKRIIRVVHRTYEFKYVFHELAERRIEAPITIFKARGDDYSFIENSGGYSARPPVVLEVAADHYSMLRQPGIEELVRTIHRRLSRDSD